MKKNYARALADYSQAIEIDPSYTAAYTGRGLIHEIRGDRTRAMRDFNAALALAPKYQDGMWAQQTAKAHLRGYGEATAGQTVSSHGEANAEHTRR
jgi:tetratricopeptide (TPR) repeat protein